MANCNFLCSGNNKEYCVGISRLLMYQSSETATPVSQPSVVAGLPFFGCVADADPRSLGDLSTLADDMTLEQCAEFCADYTFFGTEYSHECYCGNSFTGDVELVDNAECNMACAGSNLEFCGSYSRLSVYGTEPSPPAIVAGKPYAGCWLDYDPWALSDLSTSADDMTLEKCAEFCDGYNYFGGEYSDECYCGNELYSESTQADDSECDMPCAGNKAESCGAGNRISLYGGVPSQPATVAGEPFAGCWQDYDPRALSDLSTSADDMTLEKCAEFCQGYNYFGGEYQDECYCGNEIYWQSSLADDSECNMPCAGNSLELCGASNRISLYGAVPSQPETVSGWTSLGCYWDYSPRALGDASLVTSDMTLEQCAEFCDGYQYFGGEYSEECYCGNEIYYESLQTDQSECSMTCIGNNTEFCGQVNRISLYER